MFIVLELSISFKACTIRSWVKEWWGFFGRYITESGKLARSCFCTIADPWKESETNKN